MPYVDHNERRLRDTIQHETEETRRLLRNLRHVVEQGHLSEPPLQIITDLGRHAALLSRAIQQFTVRHDVVEVSGRTLYSEYEEIIDFVGEEVRREPELLSAPDSPHEYQIYRDLGFSEQEYNDLLIWKRAWQAHELDPKRAFDAFSSDVVSELMAGRYSIKLEDIVPGVAGLVGIAFDITASTATGGIAVPVLVPSCCTGLAAIALKFPEVRRKLLGRGR